MESIDVGSTVTCGMCMKETTVQFVTDRVGGKGFDLGCMHRNAVCETCQILVKDGSEDILEVVPVCRACNPEAFVYDDDDE